jgi:hypothetical protein
VTTILFIVIHIIFVYSKYRAYGYPGGIQFRYYLPLAILVGMGYILWHEQTTKNKQLLMSFFVVPSLIWGNMFYYLDQRKVYHYPIPASESASYISLRNNTVIIEGVWKACSRGEVPKLLINDQNELHAIYTKQHKQKSYVLNLNMPVTCKEYLNKIEDISTTQYCNINDQKKLTLINKTYCR